MSSTREMKKKTRRGRGGLAEWGWPDHNEYEAAKDVRVVIKFADLITAIAPKYNFLRRAPLATADYFDK